MESTKSKVILLVEDNAVEEALAIRVPKKNNIVNEVVVARDGVEALDYLFGTGAYAGRDLCLAPQVELFDLTLPRVSGLAAAPFGMITRRLMLVADEICPP